MAGLMAGKRGLIMGVANDHSIAWGIAQSVAAQGAQVAFTYQGEALGKRVKPLAETLGSSLVLPCDVEDIASVDACFAELAKAWGMDDEIDERGRHITGDTLLILFNSHNGPIQFLMPAPADADYWIPLLDTATDTPILRLRAHEPYPLQSHSLVVLKQSRPKRGLPRDRPKKQTP